MKVRKIIPALLAGGLFTIAAMPVVAQTFLPEPESCASASIGGQSGGCGSDAVNYRINLRNSCPEDVRFFWSGHNGNVGDGSGAGKRVRSGGSKTGTVHCVPQGVSPRVQSCIEYSRNRHQRLAGGSC